MIPVFNGTNYLRQSLASVLSEDQGAEQMQIEVVDNCSTEDDPEAVVREIGGGRVSFFRQAENLGAIENFNTCIRRARGHWVHILHADDMILPGFYAHAQRALVYEPIVGAIAIRVVFVDENGTWTNLSEIERPTAGLLDGTFAHRQLIRQRIQFPGMIVRRSIYEHLGGFRPDLQSSTDWDMWNRIAVRHRIYYDPRPLVCNRMHGASRTTDFMKTGQNVAYERLSIRLGCSYLKPEDVKPIRRCARHAVAIKAIWNAKELWKVHQYSVAIAQIRESLRTSMAPTVLARLIQFAAWVVFHGGRSSEPDGPEVKMYSPPNTLDAPVK